MKNLRQKKNKKAIERLSELLGDVLESFESYGIESSIPEEPTLPGFAAPVSPPEPEEPQAEELHEEEAEEEGYDYEEPEYYFDPADVQGALDEAISTLIKEGLIPKPKKSLSLTQIIVLLFGPGSELREQAESFEQLISGYEDKAHIDDLKEAFNTLKNIIRTIRSAHDQD